MLDNAFGQNSTVGGTGADGIYVTLVADNFLIDGNTWTDYGGHCIQLGDSASVTDLTDITIIK